MISIKELQNKKTGVFLSGGLTSAAVAKYLFSRGLASHIFWANVGQVDEPEIEDILKTLSLTGVPVTKVDLREQIADLSLSMVKYQAIYEGGYWNSTGALRFCLVKELAPYFRAEGCDVFTHGCVGGGNDQKRFSRYGKMYLTGLQEFVLWDAIEFTQEVRGRKDMAALLSDEAADLTRLAGKIYRSTDSCLIGTSHEGAEIENLAADFTRVEPLMSLLPWNAADKVYKVSVYFINGEVKKIDSVEGNSSGMMDLANSIGGKAGLSLKTVIENRINQTKCRGIYESPGMDLLSFAFTNLLHACLQPASLRLFHDLSHVLGKAMYEGRYGDPDALAARIACNELVKDITGDISISIYKGNLYCTGLRVYSGERNIVFQERFSDGGHIWVNRERG